MNDTSVKKSDDPSRRPRTKDEWLTPVGGKGLLLWDGKKQSVTENELLELLSPWLIVVARNATVDLPMRLKTGLDHLQEARLALLKCWRVYQRRQLVHNDISLSTYAYLSVRGAVVDGYRNRNMAKAAKRGTFLGYFSWENACLSDEYIDRREDDSISWEDRFDLAEALKSLELWERRLLNLLFAADMNLREVGELAGVSEARVCQQYKPVLKKLAEYLHVQ
jgi:RNA polymerase sigma factor (sigma-70 family)